MKATIVFVIITIIMITTVPITSLTKEVYAGEENKPKEYCKDYGGKWNDDKEKCKIEDDELMADYEDDVCDDADDSLRYPKICQPWLFDDNDDD